MHNSRLLALLKVIDETQWKETRKYLKGQLGEMSQPYTLYEFLFNNRKDLSSKSLSIDSMLRRKFKSSTRKKILNLMSQLYKEVELGLTICEMKGNTQLIELHRFKMNNRLGLYERANLVAKTLEEELTKIERVDIWDNYHLLNLYHNQYFSYNPIKYGSLGASLLKKTAKIASSISEEFNLFHRIAMVNRERMHQEDWNLTKIDISNELGGNNLEIVNILTLINKVIGHDSWEDYHALKAKVMSPELEINQDIKTLSFIVLKKFLAIEIATGASNAQEEVANLLYDAILAGKLLHNKLLPQETFLSSVTANVLIKSYGRAEKIIEYSKEKLSRDSKNEYLTVAQMVVLRGRGRYKEMIDTYNEGYINNILFNNLAYPIILQASFEEGPSTYNYIEYQIRNYKEYLKRHKVNIEHKIYEGKWNFLLILSSMIKNKPKEVILDKIESCNHLFYRTWLTAQYEDI